MKVLILSGSPRLKSSTDKLAELFVTGMGEAAQGVTFKLSQMKIHPCTGCLSCWTKTPGECAIHDDMYHIYPHWEEADLIILASPVYVDGFTGTIKNALDRLIPLGEPLMAVDSEGHSRHPARIEKQRKMLLISTCGFPEADTFDSIKMHFQAICKNMHAENVGAITISAAGMMDAPHFFDEKIELVKKAGKLFSENGKISEELLSEISKEIMDRHEYREIVNAFFQGGIWGNLKAAFKSIHAMVKMRKPPKGA
ncbi:MAG: flavodoxin family protein [Candidatus Saganbacteria bacterium]|nr:flavodoxin family protein [Candidatus Saganbacteria bacterium]